MTPIYNYLTRDELPADPKEATTVKRRACSYVLLEGKLYRRGFSIPLLKCVEEEKVPDILGEIHRGINAQHLGGRSLARKALRAGYYWPTMQNDSKEHVKRCDKCQRHADMHLAPPNDLKSLSSQWPFAWWGMDILGPFVTGSYQNKYLIVGVDYFTKWIEAEALAKITAQNILRSAPWSSEESRKTRERANWRPTGKALTASATKRATGPITWKTYKENNSLDHGTQKNLDNITAKYTTGRRGRYDHALRPQNPREEPRDPGTIRGHMTNTTLPDGWDLDQDSTSKYQDWQGTQLAMGGPKPRDQGSNNGPGPRYPRAQSPTLRRFPKPRRLSKSSRVRIHTNKYQTQTSTMNDNVNIHALKTIRAAEAKYARRPYYNARRPNT
ncbi:hypothetical protein KIW84_073357 [Lathyrus oleraceus]|uniref:Integrase zinc-binding domain-containing protein n=1 Tax=Pisum sativum TaxID=3888 RepID=A0A9D4ZYH9_PEA|nr:hypothetical protein KIW84_073357 [Pisum sativum]